MKRQPRHDLALLSFFELRQGTRELYCTADQRARGTIEQYGSRVLLILDGNVFARQLPESGADTVRDYGRRRKRSVRAIDEPSERKSRTHSSRSCWRSGRRVQTC